MITEAEVRCMHPWMSEGELNGLMLRLLERGTLKVPTQEDIAWQIKCDPNRPKRRKYWCDYPHDEQTQAYGEARRDHAFLLRCEGATLQEIGERLGATKETARRLVKASGRQMARGLRTAKWTFDAPSPD